jgi:DNA-binding NtrC family response regulator
LEQAGWEVEGALVKRRILIADDEARVLLILRDSLQRLDNDMDIVTVQNGLQALDEVREGFFDLVITDLRMPGMGGVELTRSIRALRPETTVIWITAYGCYNVNDECSEMEVYRCLDKPLEIGEIRRVVREALKSLESLDEIEKESNGNAIGR